MNVRVAPEHRQGTPIGVPFCFPGLFTRLVYPAQFRTDVRSANQITSTLFGDATFKGMS